MAFNHRVTASIAGVVTALILTLAALSAQSRSVTAKPAGSSCNSVMNHILPENATIRSASACEIEFEVALSRLALQSASPPGFALTFDGDVFKNQTFTLKPATATYLNNRLQARSDPRVDRLVLGSYPDAASPSIGFGVPPQVGTFAFDRADEDDPNRNPYRRFDLDLHNVANAATRRFDLVHIEVTIVSLGPPGSRIEGTMAGTLEACTPDPNGGGNCTGRVPVRLTGRFSVVRGKDRIVD
jgi:hypothetical protein